MGFVCRCVHSDQGSRVEGGRLIGGNCSAPGEQQYVEHHTSCELHMKFILNFNSMWTVNFHMFKVDLEKAGEPEIKLPTSIGSSEKQESSRKTSTLLTMPKPLTVWITRYCGKFLKKWEYQTT